MTPPLEPLPRLLAFPPFLYLTAFVLGWSRIILHRAGTTSLPGRVSMALTLAGPYRWTRNPMCLAMAGVYLSLGLLLNAVAPLLLFLPVFAVMDRRVIRWEERNLAAKFGEPYLAYLSRVRRWF